MGTNDVAFVVPAYNENSVLEQTLMPLLDLGEVVLVDDGSSMPVILNVTMANKIHFLRHLVNRGQGAALETGFLYILQEMPQVKYVVTFDADGQHNSEDCLEMIEKARLGFDVVLGSRFLAKKNHIPFVKKLLLKTFAALYSLAKRKKITDRHFGLRVLTRSFIEQNRLSMPGYEHADEVLEFVFKGKWKFCEHPCSVNYTEYSQSKGQPIINGLNIVFNRMITKL